MADAPKVRAIIADDENHIRMLIKTVIKGMGVEIAAEAKNGQEVIDLYRQIRPHILLMDINMPVKGGEEALKEIKTEFPEAFIIMLTSVADIETVQRCLDLGATNYILKDTPIPEMKAIIKETWTAFRAKK